MNAEWVYKERTSFFGLKLADKSRAIYGYIASPMTLKDLPDDMKKIETFQDRKPDVLDNLYTYIRNHLAHNKNGWLEIFNKNYFLIGLLILVGLFFLSTNKKYKEEIVEDKKTIESQIKKSIKDEKSILIEKTLMASIPKALESSKTTVQKKEVVENSTTIQSEKIVSYEQSLFIPLQVNFHVTNTLLSGEPLGGLLRIANQNNREVLFNLDVRMVLRYAKDKVNVIEESSKVNQNFRISSFVEQTYIFGERIFMRVRRDTKVKLIIKYNHGKTEIRNMTIVSLD